MDHLALGLGLGPELNQVGLGRLGVVPKWNHSIRKEQLDPLQRVLDVTSETQVSGEARVTPE